MFSFKKKLRVFLFPGLTPRASCLLPILILLLTVSTAGAGEAPVLKKAVFLPHWSPQAQFAGYFLAYEKGIYRKHGLDVTILTGGPQASPLEYLKKKKADFGVLWLSSAIEERARGVKVINLGQIIQKSALMLVAKKSSGIKTIEDLNGRKVGLWRQEFQIQPMALFQKYNVTVKVIPQSHSVNLFLRDGVEVASAMWYNEYHTMLISGLESDELTPIFFFEHGLNFPEDGLYCLEDTFKTDPERARAFAEASLEGWRLAFTNPEEALDIVIKYMTQAKIPANRVHQRWMLSRMKDLIQATEGETRLGRLQPDDYQRVARELESTGLIKKVPEFASFYQGRY
jgi:NitT/TauT family transport system substrate-binding protein